MEPHNEECFASENYSPYGNGDVHKGLICVTGVHEMKLSLLGEVSGPRDLGGRHIPSSANAVFQSNGKYMISTAVRIANHLISSFMLKFRNVKATMEDYKLAKTLEEENRQSKHLGWGLRPL